MDVQPQLAPFEFFRFGDQRAKMDVPPPHLFIFDDGGHPANMVVQPPLPPSEFFRFGDRLANMDVPPPHFFRYLSLQTWLYNRRYLPQNSIDLVIISQTWMFLERYLPQ